MSYRDVILAESSLVSYYELEETSGTACADSKGPNGGTYTDGYTLNQVGALTPADKAVAFDGSTGFIQVNSTTGIPVGASLRTLEFWMKSADATGWVPVAGWGTAEVDKMFKVGHHTTEWGIWVATGGTDNFYGAYSADGLWHHVVAAMESATSIRVYVDGADRGAQTYPTINTTMGADKVTIAKIPGAFFLGSVDEVAIYNAALTSTQVAAHYAAKTTTAGFAHSQAVVIV